MDTPKPLEFRAGALDYFILTILSVILIYIPFIGWAILVNYAGGWFAGRATVTGKKVAFKAGFGESLKLVTVGFFLMLITLGIYSFWFYPKLYRYFASHTQFAGEAPVSPAASEETPAPAAVEASVPRTP